MNWKITDFTEEIKKTMKDNKLNRKTVATWFNKLEDAHIHYVNRMEDTGEKIYDELDLEIGIFIKKKRNENVSLGMIFNEIRSQFEVRSLPSGKEIDENREGSTPKELVAHIIQQLDMTNLKKEIIHEVKIAYEEVATAQLSHILESYDALIERLPNRESYEEEREKRFQEMVLKKRVEYQLEKEAFLLWTSKPETERYRKIGWFKKEEDTLKRDLFVKEYVNSHFAERIKKEIFYEKMSERQVVGEVTVLTPALIR